MPLARREATLRRAATCSGAGLHTGQPCFVRIAPAAAGHGLVFRRIVGGVVHDVPALWTNRRSRPLCTAIQVGDGPLVRTVEHLMAAFAALRIDDALVEIDAEELPIFDGSAEPWVRLLKAAGRVELDARRRYLRVTTPVEVRSGERRQRVEPADDFTLYATITLSYFGRLEWEGAVDPSSFERDLAASRSFGRFRWAFLSRLAGLFGREPVLRGATFANTAALFRDRAIGGLRWPDEPVRHRALDVVGDLALAGHPILGKVTAIMPGHEHNHALLAALMNDRTAWELVEFDEEGRAAPV